MVKNVSRFTKGTVVVVTDKNDPRFEKQGEVVNIHDDDHEEGPIEVSIEELRRRHSYMSDEVRKMLGYHYKFRFFPEQLAKTQWSLEQRIQRLFGRRPTDFLGGVFVPKDELDSSADCMVEGCTKSQSNKTLVNCWGAVCEQFLCDQCHEDWNGAWPGDLPLPLK